MTHAARWAGGSPGAVGGAEPPGAAKPGGIATGGAVTAGGGTMRARSGGGCGALPLNEVAALLDEPRTLAGGTAPRRLCNVW
jgi:hypothetical protein